MTSSILPHSLHVTIINELFTNLEWLLGIQEGRHTPMHMVEMLYVMVEHPAVVSASALDTLCTLE